MLKKRVIGVITVRQGWAVQSFGYRRWLPLGRPEVMAQNLDRWGADEILLQCIDRSRDNAGPDLELLDRIGEVGLSTPLIYAGGISSPQQASAVVQSAADRVMVDALLHDDLGAVRRISEHLGAQAILAALPLATHEQTLQWLDHRSGTRRELPADVLALLRDGVISETLLIDWQHEGCLGAFDLALVHRFPLQDVPLLAFGGLSEASQMRALLSSPRVVAVAIGNFLSYREHALQAYKQQLGGMPLRPHRYAGSPD